VAVAVRTTVGSLLITACLMAAASLSVAHAASGPSAADLGISAEVGFGREASNATWNLVQITASPSVPLSGRLEVRSSGSFGVTTEERPFEVAAGATRVVHLLLPPTEELTVAFIDDDAGRVPVRSGFADGDLVALVGGFGDAPALPSPLNTAGTDRPIRGVSVDPAILALGPRSLDALDALLITSADLAALPGDQRGDLEVAVSNGLELLVHVRPEDGPLVFAWDPTTDAEAWPILPDQLGLRGAEPIATSMRAGNGRVTATSAAPGDGDVGDARELWSALVQLRAQAGQPLGALDQGGDLSTMLFGGGSNLPSPWPFALFALAFVVVVGPANGFVLRRLGRRELAWVTVPVITLVFTAGALGAATARAPADTPVVRAAWWMDGIGQELTVASVQSPGRGITEVRLPGARDGVAGGRWSEIPSTLDRNSEETTLRVRLETLQLASIVAWGVPGGVPPLDVEATMEGGRLEVDVTNTTGVAIDEVEVLFATSSEDVGRIAPGATTTIAMAELGDQLSRPRNGGMGLRMGMDMGMGRVPNQTEDPGPGSARGLLEWDQLSGNPGTVWVVGSTTSDLGLAVPTVAGSLDDRGTFVAVGVTPTHLGGDVLPHEVSRAVLRTTPWAAWRPSPLELEGGGETVLRYQLPGPSHRGELRSTLDIGMNLAERDMGFEDPWSEGCFEVSEVDSEGNIEDPVEVCGTDIGCPMDAIECSGSDTSITACFEDGRCQIAERLGDLDGQDDPALPRDGSGLEVFDHDTAAWVPLEQAFPKTGPPREGLVSARGDVLVRSRGAGMLDLGQRGLGVAIEDGSANDQGASA
jgi:hypothetical protein